MGGRNGDDDPGTDPDFWAIRNSLLPATPDMERAADLLSEAADMILANRDEEAVTLIQQADITTLFDVREQASRARPPVFSVHRLRKVANLLPEITKEQKAARFRSESPLGEAVFRRDGWRCRYCGCRVVPAKARKWMRKRLPGVIRWIPGANPEGHAGFWTLWASVDHVIPRARGGRNEPENLVTACTVCNFAKDEYTLEQLGLADPRSRPPVLDGWDGLTRLFADATRRTSPLPAEPGIPSPRPGRGPAGETVPASKRSKPTSRTPPLSPAEYFGQLEAHRPNSAQPFQVFLASLGDVGVVPEFMRSVVLRFSLDEGERVSAGSIFTDGRVWCGDAFYYAEKHGRRDVGERYLAAIADFTDGELRSAGRQIPEVFGQDGKLINVAALVPNAESWRNAIANFVRDMRAVTQHP